MAFPAQSSNAQELEELANLMFGLSNSLPEMGNAIAQTVAAAIVDAVVRDTPVDTGLARSNWFVSLGGEDTATLLPPYFPSIHGGVAETANADAAVEAGQQKISQSLPGEEIWIQNNIPYLPFLNYPPPHSPQAPAYFVELGVAEALGKFDGMTFVFDAGIFI